MWGSVNATKVEKEIAATLFCLAQNYNAVPALLKLEPGDLTIPKLIGLATTYGVNSIDLSRAECHILLQFRELELIMKKPLHELWFDVQNDVYGMLIALNE